MITSFIGFVLEVLFAINRINSNTDIRFPGLNNRPAVCEISQECLNRINRDGNDSCLNSDDKIDLQLDQRFAILNKTSVKQGSDHFANESLCSRIKTFC